MTFSLDSDKDNICDNNLFYFVNCIYVCDEGICHIGMKS